MKSLQELYDQYSKDHQNPINQKIHYICVPLIVYSLLGALWSLPTPSFFPSMVNWSVLFTSCVLIYYFILSIKHFFMMFVVAFVFWSSFYFIEQMQLPLLGLCIIIFVLAWIGQFYGHKVEGKKPSFLTDLTYLFIGPLWVAEKTFFKK